MSSQNNVDNKVETKAVVPARTEITQTKHGKIILTTELQKQIKYLHEQVGAKEWCGMLFYRHIEGEFDAPETLVFEATDVYLMDIGREAYTEADMDSDSIIDKWDAVNRHYPNGDPDDTKYSDFKTGLIHTHHNMAAFFSGTDMSELRDSTPAHNYYVSLIVNFNGSYVAKVAFIAKRVINLNYKGTKDNDKSFVEETEVLMMIDLDIIKEQEEVAISDFFRSRHASVKKQGAERAQAAAAKYTSHAGNYATNRSRFAQQEDVGDDWLDHYSPANQASSGNKGGQSNGNKLITAGKSNAIIGKQMPAPSNALTTQVPSKLEVEITEKILDWLVDGCDIYGDMMPNGRFDSIKDALEFFEEYFDKIGHDSHECKYFIQRLQRQMDCFSPYHPKSVERLGCEAMTECAYANCSIAMEMHTLFESYPIYVNELKKAGLGKREKNTAVHARKK